MATTISEVIWLKALLLDLNMDVAQPIKLYCDSISAIYIFKNLVGFECGCCSTYKIVL